MRDQMWTRDAECVSTEVEDALVLLDLDGGTYFALNGPAADVWLALEVPCSTGALIDRLTAKYAVSAEHCAKSLDTLLADLLDKGLARLAG